MNELEELIDAGLLSLVSLPKSKWFQFFWKLKKPTATTEQLLNNYATIV